MKLSQNLLVAYMLILAGCADTNKDQATDQPHANGEKDLVPVELKAIDQELPEATIIRVELDADGNPIEGSEEMRAVSQIGDESLADSFAAKGELPNAASNELDADTSTQSFFVTRLFNDAATPGQGYGEEGQGQYPDEDQGQYPDQDQGQYPDQDQGPAGPVAPTPATPTQETTYETRNGPSTAAYPISRKVIYENRTRNIYPQQQVDIYPIETVRIHPTRTTTRVHPVQTQIQYVGNYCQPSQYNYCGYGARYYPTVSYGGYQQYYHYQSYQNHGRYRYYRYCRPSIFQRFGWGW